MAGRVKIWGDFAINLLIHGMLRLVKIVPYSIRVPIVGGLVKHIVSPLAGYKKRIKNNLLYACPELGNREISKLCREVPDNVGRSLIELYSSKEFIRRNENTMLVGTGVAELATANQAGRPAILVTAHIGNYDAARVALISLGYKIGAVYMPMTNSFFNPHYETAMANMGGELFPRGRKGLAEMVRFLRNGGMTFFVTDQYMNNGADLLFFGKSAPTALSAANMALKYDALLVPIYALRCKNGLDFEITVNAPIPHSDAETMTQALNDGLEKVVRQNMGQWLWIHRRWKPERPRKNNKKSQ